MKSVPILFLLFLGLACKPGRTTQEESSTGIALGQVDTRLKEASGLVASINNTGFLWTLNDSGNPAEVFLIDQHANIKMVVTLIGARNRDWEDLVIDTNADGKSYLYVADIGDNDSRHAYKLLYRFEEPVLTGGTEQSITLFDTLIFKMPDGPCNAETVLIDPITHDVFMIAKRMGASGLYHLPNLNPNDTITAKKVMDVSVWEIVAGSISSDGQQVLLKSYDAIHYWRRSGNESLREVLSKAPTELRYERESQGEAIAWSRSGTEFYTLSESRHGKRASLMMHTMKTH